MLASNFTNNKLLQVLELICSDMLYQYHGVFDGYIVFFKYLVEIWKAHIFPNLLMAASVFISDKLDSSFCENP